MKIFSRIKEKKGMTYTELVVAMALLMFIIVSFTPMLLSSYNSIYKAGEKSENTYNAKTGVEHQLALRTSYTTHILKTTFGDLADSFNANLREAVYGLKTTLGDSIESLFHNGIVKIQIISGSHINDDTVNKNIVLKISGLQIDSVGSSAPEKTYYGTQHDLQAKYRVRLIVKKPDYTKSTDYSGAQTDIYYESCNINILPDIALKPAGSTASDDEFSDYKSGIVRVRILDEDFTDSPLKIMMDYYDENTEMTSETPNATHLSTEEYRTTSAYLYIESPTIILGGDSTSSNVYFTTAGLNEKKVKGSDEPLYSLQVPEGREMKTLTSAVPSTTFKSVTFITNDPTDGFGPYYVLTGTNGVMLRMYIPTTMGSVSSKTGYSYIKSIVPGSSNYGTNAVREAGVTKLLYKNLWGGDFSHQFGFSSYYHSMGYSNASCTDDSCWYTSSNYKGSSSYNKFGTQTALAMYYNGARMGYDYKMQNNRKISYVLTEKGSPLRVSSSITSDGAESGYNRLWENEYSYFNRNIVEATKSSDKNALKAHTTHIEEEELSYVRIKSMTNIGNTSADLFKTSTYSESREDSDTADSRTNYIDGSGANGKAVSSLTVTSAVYDQGMGGMFYSGFADANLVLTQLDNTSNKDNYASEIGWTRLLDWIAGTGQGSAYYLSNTPSGLVVNKISSNTISDCFNLLSSGHGDSTEVLTGAALASFYDNRPSTVSKMLLSDVKATFGYSSNREKVYAKITVNESGSESVRACEEYYFLSHYGSKSHLAQHFAIETSDKAHNGSVLNSVENDYYNMWFPGEFYTLTNSANKDGVTVAVGYTMSGSVYQRVNPDHTSNTSTAVGGLYNDAVLAAKISEETSLTNILYYKEKSGFDSTSLTANNIGKYKDVYPGGYGTHSRMSVRFTAVDLQVISNGNDKKWYAYYGDNHGRVFRSLVAYGITTGTESSSSKTVVPKINDVITPLNIGSDLGDADAGFMEEIKYNNQSLSTYFSEITNISADDSTIVVSGIPVAGGTYRVLVINRVQNSSSSGATVSDVWRYALVTLANDSAKLYQPKDSVIVDGVYYATGIHGTSNGYIICIKLDDIINCINSGKDVTGISMYNSVTETYHGGYIAIDATAVEQPGGTTVRVSSLLSTDITGFKMYAIGAKGAN